MKLLTTSFLPLLWLLCFSGSSMAQCLTAEGRAQLFEELLQKSRDREAWSPHKTINGYEAFATAAEKFRQQFRDADTDQKLARAIYLLSNLRQDAHLTIRKVSGGLSFAKGVAYAPIRFTPDFSGAIHDYFVSDTASNVSLSTPVEITDQLLAVNGIPIQRYISQLRPYMIHSTENNLRWKLARYLSVNYALIDPSLYNGDTVSYLLKKPDGRQYTVKTQYQVGKKMKWQGNGRPTFEGFQKVMQRQNFNLYVGRDEQQIVLIDWRDLEWKLRSDLKALMRYAKRHDLLDHDVIFYAPFSSGGRGSPRVVRRLTGKSFKTTFGNLRISDLTTRFGNSRKGKIKKWVQKAVNNGANYTSNEPFKLRYFRADSPGIMRPAKRHFSGNIVGVFSSLGGSNLDQMFAMIVDNQLMPTIGYPTGGYSNTWELSEIIKCPDSGEKLVKYYWNVGHTIRPNGEVLEGNPAMPDELIPVTRENYPHYWEGLIERALEILQNTRE